MKPRPLLRRPSFWLGLFIVCFLEWAWWDSYQKCVELNFRTQIVARSEGGTYFLSSPMLPIFKAVDVPLFDKEAGRERTEAELWNLGVNFVRIPDSLVFFSFLGLWVGWLAFPEWLRKKRRERRIDKLE